VEQIYNNASERTHMVYVGSLAGALPGGPGHSHQAVNDIAVLGTIPGMTMVEPCCAAEVAPLLDYLLSGSDGCGYLRLVSIPCEIPYELPADYRAVPGVGTELRTGKDGVLIGYGPVLLPQAWTAAELLQEKHGIELAVVNLSWLNKVSDDWLRTIVGDKHAVITLDNHLVGGGQGRMIAAAVARLRLAQAPWVHSIGLDDFPVCGQNDEVLHAHGLDTCGIADVVAQAIG
jgi:transketolase